MSFAERALQEEQIEFLHRVNSEAEARRSTKSLILSKAKVMSFEDLEHARGRGAATKQNAGKKKRGRKLKSQVTMEIDPGLLPMPQSRVPVARME